MSHSHELHGARALPSTKATKALFVAFVLTSVFVAVELAGGAIFRSLALSADGVHLFSDAFALALALIAQRFASRPASSTHSFGWRRIEVISAFASGLLLFGVSLFIVIEATRRIGDPVDTQATGLIVVAALGMAINLFCAYILHGSSHDNMNVRAASLHTLGDAAGSAGALIAGIALACGAPSWADPVASIVIATLVATASLRLLHDTTRVLMEGTPPHIDPSAIEEVLAQEPSVMRVHHMHIWTPVPGLPALSAHIELRGIETLHEAQSEGVRLKALIATRFGIEHSTLELECHPCSPTDSTH